MHTVISSFSHRADAQRAMDRLAEAGFAREDMHMQHHEIRGEPGMKAGTWDGMEREIAVDRSVLESVGHFFTSLFGQDNPSGHVRSYSEAVTRGECVLVVDAQDEAQAERAAQIVSDLGGQDRNIVPRSSTHRPLREIVGPRTAEPVQRYQEAPSAARTQTERERAAAAGEVRALDQGGQVSEPAERSRDPELTRDPPLRYADKDKPIR